MEQSTPHSSRKRSRTSQSLTGDSSPLAVGTPLSAIKRRRLDTVKSSPSTPKALQALKNAIGGVFRPGLLTAQIPSADTTDTDEISLDLADNDEQSADELAEPDTPSKRRPVEDGTALQNRDGTSPVFSRLQRRARDALSSPVRLHNRRDEKATVAADSLEIAESEDELGPPATAKSVDKVGNPATADDSTRRAISAEQPTRPIPTDGPVQTSPEEGKAAVETVRLSRERRRPRRYSSEMLVEPVLNEPKSILTPSKRNEKEARKSVAFEATDAAAQVEPKSTPIVDGQVVKRKRGRPRKIPIEGSMAQVPVKTPIEAPAEKLVEFLAETAESTIVKEVEPPKKRSHKKKVKPGRADAPEEEEGTGDAIVDESFCAVCAGGDSEESNVIILCDNCDLAVHQVCYDVPVIPEGDWLCNDCRPDEELFMDMDVDVDINTQILLDLGPSNIPDIDEFDYHLQVTQKILLDKLTGKRRLKLQGLDDEYQKVKQVVEQTVMAGEGNSILVIGARGSGKTTLVENVISELSAGYRQNFHIVRLNGFIHTDDKLALKEIWRQLGVEMEVDEDVTSKTNNYADTLTSLLALLSHPSEISETDSDRTAKSVVFVLDEFDLFTTHPRQTLLYNLFDTAQARKAPIVVLGLTTKIDVVETLEKRVKSRFSHRYVHLSLPKTLATYWEISRQGLLVDLEELVSEGFDPGMPGQYQFQVYWDAMVNDLYHNDTTFKTHLQTHFYRTKSVTSFLTTCILPIANLSPSSLPLTGRSFIPSLTLPSLTPPDSKLSLLPSLAALDLSLLIAAARLDIILDTDTCNFAMAYDEYVSLTTKHKIQTAATGVAALGGGVKVWGREVAWGAWERLIEVELLVPAGVGQGASGREGRMWRVDVGLEEIEGGAGGELSTVMVKWCRTI